MKKIIAAIGLVTVASVGATLIAQTVGAPPKLTAQDLLDIRQLIDAYPHLLDNCTNNGNDYADLYTPDATFGVSQEWGKAKIWFRGREQLRRAGGGTDTGCRPSPSQGHAYHLNINPTIAAVGRQAYTYSAGVKLAQVARGEVEAYASSYTGFHSWDVCAGQLLVQEAGGKITDLHGKPIRYRQDGSGAIEGTASSNGLLQAQTLACCTGYAS